MQDWKQDFKQEMKTRAAREIAGDYGVDVLRAFDKSFQDDKYDFDYERFKKHTIAKTKRVEVFILIFAFGLLVSFVNDFFGSLILIASMFFAGYSLIDFFRSREQKQKFPDYENKLINLMVQSPKMPDRFNDKNVIINCDEISDSGDYVVFTIKVNDVVGGIEFIEDNCDKWAASFGDRDGAELSVINTGFYRLKFDTAGSINERASVSW